MPTNPFKSFHPVPRSQEILDVAFNRASKKLKSPGTRSSHLVKARTREYSRVKIVFEYLGERIQKIVKSVPNIGDLPEFYKQLADLLVDNDQLRLNLGKLQGVLRVLRKLKSEYGYKIRTARTPHEAEVARRDTYGRVSSLINQQDSTLAYLESVRKKLSRIPVVDPERPAIVVAGYPNVGKSSIVRAISTGKPAVASYPFTTKDISIGIIRNERDEDRFTRFSRFQVIDTPGILDRPMSSRNNIEKQAILSFQVLASAIVFLFDPTLTSGYELEPQVELYREIQSDICTPKGIPLLPVINKVDLATSEEIDHVIETLGGGHVGGSILQVSATKLESLKPLISRIIELAKFSNQV
ncbi:MAG: NOG1 family protein [Promethearchaeota archaeon]